MPTVDDYQLQLKQLHPRGKLWTSLLRDDSVYSKFLKGIATEFAHINERVVDLMAEADPRSTVELLPDWEQAHAIPGDCGYLGATIAERQLLLTAKVTEQVSDNNQELIDTAEFLGFAPATTTEYESHSVDSSVDAPLYGEDWRFAIKLSVTDQAVIAFTVESAVDESLGQELPRTKLECTINKTAPAHCVVIFEYL